MRSFFSDTEDSQISSPTDKINQAQPLKLSHRGKLKKNSSSKKAESEAILIEEDDVGEIETWVSKKLKANDHSLAKKLNETDLSTKILFSKKKGDPTYRSLADLKKNLGYFHRDVNMVLSLLPKDLPQIFFDGLLPFAKCTLFEEIFPSLNLDQMVAGHRPRSQAANLLQSKKSSNIIIDDNDVEEEGREASPIEITDGEQIEEATHAKPLQKGNCSIHHNSPFCYCNPAVHVFKSFQERIELFLSLMPEQLSSCFSKGLYPYIQFKEIYKTLPSLNLDQVKPALKHNRREMNLARANSGIGYVIDLECQPNLAE